MTDWQPIATAPKDGTIVKPRTNAGRPAMIDREKVHDAIEHGRLSSRSPTEDVDNAIKAVLDGLMDPSAEALEASGTMGGYTYEGPGPPYCTGPDADHIDWWQSMLKAERARLFPEDASG